jgi:hypothetical protein
MSESKFSIKEQCLIFFQNEDIKRNMKEIIKPIATMVYNEIFIYIWFVCIYNVVLFIIIIIVLILLLSKNREIHNIAHP